MENISPQVLLGCLNYAIKQGNNYYKINSWTYSFEKIENGSILDVSWSSDGNICAGACGNGQVIFGYIVDRQLNYENWEVNLNEDNK